MHQRNRNVENAMRRAIRPPKRPTPDQKFWHGWLVGFLVATIIATAYWLAGANGDSCNELIEHERLALQMNSPRADEYRIKWNHFCGPDRVWYSLKEGRQE